MSTALKFFHYTSELIDRKVFCADQKDLDRYIQGQIGQWESNNTARNYVALNENGEAVSLFSLSANRLRSEDIPNPDANYPSELDLPTIKIGRLVVDKKYRGVDIGKQTLTKAIFLFIESSKLIGSIGLTVDAKDEIMKVRGVQKHIYEFYEKYGFIRLTDSPENGMYPMILYTSTVRKKYPSFFQAPV